MSGGMRHDRSKETKPDLQVLAYDQSRKNELIRFAFFVGQLAGIVPSCALIRREGRPTKRLHRSSRRLNGLAL